MSAQKLGILALLSLLSILLTVLAVTTGPALASGAPGLDQLPGLAGIPPWGFDTGDPLTAETGSCARAYGGIDPDHTHVAEMSGDPGNAIATHVRVTSSTDASCTVGTVGVMMMYAS